MGENLTVRQKAKIAYLKRLLLVWVKLTHVKWKKVFVDVEDGYINIVLYRIMWMEDAAGNKNRHFDPYFKDCELKDLSKLVSSYKKKIRTEFKIRHLSEEDKDKKREQLNLYTK